MADLNELLKKRIIYEIPAMEQSRVTKNRIYKTVEERDLLLDVYYPANMRDGEQRPAVIFVHGLGPAELLKHIKDCGQYVSWGQLIAASGFIAITFNHRSPDERTSFKDTGEDVDQLVTYVREHALELQIDPEKLAIWSGSAGVPLGARSALRGTPAFVKCLVAYYGPLDLRPMQPGWHLTEEEVHEFSALTYLEEQASKLPPILITRAGLDYPEIHAAIDTFLKEASAKNVTLDFMTHPAGHHAFDILDDVPRSHEIIQRTLEFIKASLNTP
ncbi:MAG: alpha/beta hydrolase [Ktedonobacteraceae bacterium]|nr:alpha/beta hydrolase [Ktedonobacteraceae bacterium]